MSSTPTDTAIEEGRFDVAEQQLLIAPDTQARHDSERTDSAGSQNSGSRLLLGLLLLVCTLIACFFVATAVRDSEPQRISSWDEAESADDRATSVPSDAAQDQTPLADSASAAASATAATETTPAPSCASSPHLHAFVFTCFRPGADTLAFASALARDTVFPVLLVVDDDVWRWSDSWLHPRVHVVQVPHAQVLARNFTHLTHPQEIYIPANWQVQSLEKAMTFLAPMYLSPDIDVDRADALASRSSSSRALFALAPHRFCRVWVIEDDVFIPSVHAAVHLDQVVSDAGSVDLVTAGMNRWFPSNGWPHWNQLEQSRWRHFAPNTTWAASMINAFAVSARCMHTLLSIPGTHGRFMFSEALIPTLALWHRFTHLQPAELHSLHWRRPPMVNQQPVGVDWQLEDLLREGRPEAELAWYHPAKNHTLRAELRQALQRRVEEKERIRREASASKNAVP